MYIVVVQSLSHVWLFVTQWTVACQASLSSIISQTLLKFMSVNSVMAIQYIHLLPPPSPFAFNLSQHQIFANELTLHFRWPKYWSFSFSNSPFNENSGLISFRIDWSDLLAVQGSSPALQFEGINSSAVCLLYGPALTPVHDYWRNHSFDCIDLSTKSRCTTWELWVKFYLGQNEDCRPGGSTSDSSENCSKLAVGEGQYIRFWWRGSSIPLSPHFTKGFLLVMRIWCHHEGI